MTKHIIDKAEQGHLALPMRRFLALDRRHSGMGVSAALSRAPRLRNGARLLERFCRIERRGLEKV